MCAGAVAWLTIAVFGIDMILSPAWSFCIDIGGSHAGKVSGTMNMAGNLGSAVVALAFPAFSQNRTMRDLRFVPAPRLFDEKAPQLGRLQQPALETEGFLEVPLLPERVGRLPGERDIQPPLPPVVHLHPRRRLDVPDELRIALE